VHPLASAGSESSNRVLSNLLGDRHRRPTQAAARSLGVPSVMQGMPELRRVADAKPSDQRRLSHPLRHVRLNHVANFDVVEIL
jgi:hypothetical protein